MAAPAETTWFDSAAELRAWLERQGTEATELWVELIKQGARKEGVTYAEAADLMLCFGWAEAVRYGSSGDTFAMRFTPRKAKSTWSARNVRRAEELIAAGLMSPAGQRAFDARDAERSEIYSYERKAVGLSEAYLKRLKADKRAWAWWSAAAPSYRKAAEWWVMSAKQTATQEKRLATLITDCANGRKVKPLTPPQERKDR
ncbi:MAG TPA: YdeI/OmpD-associated family protein [Flavobacteriales bacterium]|jgi:uncharacterized protein YdeI (YjbR/CyaY-like superfamily)|nr:YdeI/OmpD-associated family protein [Flavobacteriales bacterium]